MAADDYSDKDKHEDIKVLHGMGYAQELDRSMSKFSNFAISFSIISSCRAGSTRWVRRPRVQAAPPSASAGRSVC